MKFDAWTYNGTVPGPTVRATEGDEIEVMFTNKGRHPHSIHFHGIHRGGMDGMRHANPGGSLLYAFPARPAGLHLYQCHAAPLAEHAARGLYGAFIIDPREGRPPAQELVLVQSGFDVDGDEANELYAFNGRPFYYEKYPIIVERSTTVRIYLVNMTEYDPVNSFHLHGDFFRLYRTGTVKEPEYTDTVTLGQGERCIIEIDFHHAGAYMFHSHQSRIAESGCRGWFNVVEKGSPELAGAGPLGCTRTSSPNALPAPASSAPRRSGSTDTAQSGSRHPLSSRTREGLCPRHLPAVRSARPGDPRPRSRPDD